MFIKELRIQNYRTFKNVSFTFDPHANYLVGDNNIGKSNLLDLLYTVTHGLGFHESDFLDPDDPISMRITLSASDTGVMDALHLELKQSVQEVIPRLFDKDSKKELPIEFMRGLFYINYSLSNVPRNLLSDDELRKIIALFYNFFSDSTDNAAETESLLKKMGIAADLSGGAEKATMALTNAIFYSSGEPYSASNWKLMVAIGIHLLVLLKDKKDSRAVPFEEMIVEDKTGKRLLPLMISIDDPELHLNPFLQKAVLSFIQSILDNKIPFFQKIIHHELGVDGLNGQLFVVTHSTDALINDYRKIIRLYWDDVKQVQAVCGSLFHINQEVEKHLIMHFPEVKEALYAKCTILVEGETEYGSFGYFARTLGVHLDYHGICLINARGESSISKIAELIRYFHIPAVCFYDRDVINERKSSKYIFYTDYICYEMDVVNRCLSLNRRDVLDTVIREVDDYSDLVPSAAVKKAVAKLGITNKRYHARKLKNISSRDIKSLRFYYFAWLYSNKGVIIGRSLGLHMKKDEIPPAFVRAIYAAVTYSHTPVADEEGNFYKEK